MGRKWKLGVLGLGEGRSIISAALASEQWELANICDLNETLCHKRMREFGLTRYTLSYEEMLEDPDVDVIGIYTPDQLHARHIMMALAAGKHVIITKPLMVSLDQAQELLDAQRDAGKYVMVGQSSRYYEATMRQRRDYEAGKHGELITVETRYTSDSRWFLKKAWSHQKGFSWQYNFLIHALDLAVWYLPEAEEVYAAGVVSQNSLEYGIHCPDSIKVLMRDTIGRTASVMGCYASPSFRNPIESMISCTVRGTKGISRGGSELKYYSKFDSEGSEMKVEDFSSMKSYYDRFGNGTHHAGEYQNYINYFADCLDAGRTPMPDVCEGIRTLAVMEAVQRSMDTHTVVRVSEILKERGLKV